MPFVSRVKLRILNVLREGPAHGYVIAMRADLAKSNIYTHVKWLREQGFVKVEERQGQKGTVKVYRLTAKGRKLLEALSDIA